MGSLSPHSAHSLRTVRFSYSVVCRHQGNNISLFILYSAHMNLSYNTWLLPLSAGATMRVILDIGGSLAILVSACTVILYTLLGGLYSVAYTDVIQLVFITLSLASPVHFFVTGFLTKGKNPVLLFGMSQTKNNSTNTSPCPTAPLQENRSPETSYSPYAFQTVLTSYWPCWVNAAAHK